MIKKIIILVLTVFLNINYAQNIEEGLIHYYSFDEGEGYTLKDSISNNNGLVSGDIIWVEGKSGKAISFSKERNTRIKIPHSSSLNLKKIGISVWIKTDSSSHGTIIEKWFSNKTIGWRLGYSPPYVNFVLYSDKPFPDGKYYKDLFSKKPVNDNQWHNITAVYNGEKAIIYIDGKEDAKENIEIDISGGNKADITVGYREYEGGASFFNGVIDEVKIYKCNPLLISQFSELINKCRTILSSIKALSLREEIEGKIRDMERCLEERNEEKMEEYLNSRKEMIEKIYSSALESLLEETEMEKEKYQVPVPAGYQAEVKGRKSLDDILTEWKSTGGKEGNASLDSETVKAGRHSLRFDIKIDHFNEGVYPVGWPSITHRFEPPADWREYNGISFWVRVSDNTKDKKQNKIYILRLHLRNRGQNASGLSKIIINKVDQWQFFMIPITKNNIPMPLDKVEHIQFFISESDYKNGDEITFYIDGITLFKTEIYPEMPKEKEVFMWLCLGNPEWAYLLDDSTERITGFARITTGARCSLSKEDEILFTFHDVFGSFGERPGWERIKKGGLNIPVKQYLMKIQKECPAGTTTELNLSIPVKGLNLIPGYYYVTMDIKKEGKSITSGRVGCDDFYLRRRNESMVESAIGYRLGMGLFCRDMLFGGVMSKTELCLPGTYDPLEIETYPNFLQRYAVDTGKYGEHFEMGISGCVFAATALRAKRDIERARFVEYIMKDTIDYIINHLLCEDGSVLSGDNDLARKYAGILMGKGSPSSSNTFRNADQIGELLRTLARVVLHLQNVPEEEKTVQRYLETGEKIANFLVKHSTEDVENFGPTLKVFYFTGFGKEMKKTLRTEQEGSPCIVYHPRVGSGVNYFAYAMAIAGRQIPEEWKKVLNNTLLWHMDILTKNKGHYDIVCGDRVEGGCHRPLGNIYVGEFFIGQYFYSKQIGDKKGMDIASKGAKISFEFLLEHGGPRGKPYKEGGIGFDSQWVRPYLYWLFTEYINNIENNERMKEFMQERSYDWEVVRKWADTFSRVYISSPRISPWAGGERLSQLGFLGCRLLEEIGKPFKYSKP